MHNKTRKPDRNQLVNIYKVNPEFKINYKFEINRFWNYNSLRKNNL